MFAPAAASLILLLGMQWSLDLLLVVAGLGLFTASYRSLRSGEGMYDRESIRWMFYSGIGGMVIGAVLVCWGITLFSLLNP